MTPEDYAKKGDAEYFKTADLEVLRSYRHKAKDDILSMAAYLNQLECCKEIYNRCPEKLFSTNVYGNNGIHHASFYIPKDVRVLEFLVNMGAKTVGQNGGSKSAFTDWLKMRNNAGETALCRGSWNYEPTKFWVDIDVKYQLGLLSIADGKGKTPLHWAVEKQILEIVQLLTQQEPDFNYEADQNGRTPLLIAIENTTSKETKDINTAVKIRNVLLEKQPKQTKVRIGDEGWTVLHHASAKGDIDAIKEIIRVCVDCVDIRDNKGRTFLQVAIENKHYLVVDYVLQLLKGAETVLKNVDNEKSNCERVMKECQEEVEKLKAEMKEKHNVITSQTHKLSIVEQNLKIASIALEESRTLIASLRENLAREKALTAEARAEVDNLQGINDTQAGQIDWSDRVIGCHLARCPSLNDDIQHCNKNPPTPEPIEEEPSVEEEYDE